MMNSYIFITLVLLVFFEGISQEKEKSKDTREVKESVSNDESKEIQELLKEIKEKETAGASFKNFEKNNQNFILEEQIEPQIQIQDLQKGMDLQRALESKSTSFRVGLESSSTQELVQELVQEATIEIDKREGQKTLITDDPRETGALDIEDEESEQEAQSQEELVIAVESLQESPQEMIFSPDRLYGPSQFDSRIEVRQLQPTINWQWLILRRNQSIGIVVEKSNIRLIADDLYQLDISSKLGTIYNLCDKESFQDQPVVGVGTSFIIGEKQMITAQHVFSKPISEYAIVFGFEMINQNGIVETVFTSQNIYYPKKVLKSFDEYDAIIFEVERSINFPILKWKNSTTLENNSEIYMIGHPTGLPKKIAVNAGITDNSHPQYFYTSLDSFQGNSGSPVFDFKTHKVIGLLVSGELDYQFNGTCFETTLCKIPYCKGEKVIRIERILQE